MGKEIIEGNKLIAEFMGYELVSIGYFGCPDETEWQRENEDWMGLVSLIDVGDYFVNVSENKFFEFEDIQYHTSWDWLMPVVDKIIKTHPLMENAFAKTSKVVSTLMYVQIDRTWEAVVEFIEWYNSNKKL